MSEQAWSVDSHLRNTVGDDGEPSRLFRIAAPLLVLLVLTFFAGDWHFPEKSKWLFVAALCALCAIELAWGVLRSSFSFDRLDSAAVFLLGWAAVSLLWASDRLTGIDSLFHWGMLTIIFLAFRRSISTKVSIGIATAVALGMLWTLFAQTQSESKLTFWGTYFNQNFWTEALLLGLPFLYILHRRLQTSYLRWPVWILAAAVVAALLFYIPSKIELLTWLALATFFTFVTLMRRSKALAFGSIAAMLLAGCLLVYFGWDSLAVRSSKGFKGSIEPRAELLVNTVAMWWDRPWLGTGIGDFSASYPDYQDRYQRLTNADETMHKELLVEPGAAHNDFIQFLAVFGLAGIGIVVASIYLARDRLRNWRATPETVAGALIVLSCAANMLVEFPWQNSATALLSTLGLALLLPTASRDQDGAVLNEYPFALRFIAGFAAAGLIGFCIWWGYRYAPANHAYWYVGMHVTQTRADLALPFNQEAIARYPFDESFRRQLFSTLIATTDLNQGQPIAPPGIYDEFFLISTTTGLTGGMLNLRIKYLAMSGRFHERIDEVRALRRRLLRLHYLTPDTWIAEGIICENLRDPDCIDNALREYMALVKGVVPGERRLVVDTLKSNALLLRGEAKFR